MLATSFQKCAQYIISPTLNTKTVYLILPVRWQSSQIVTLVCQYITFFLSCYENKAELVTKSLIYYPMCFYQNSFSIKFLPAMRCVFIMAFGFLGWMGFSKRPLWTFIRLIFLEKHPKSIWKNSATHFSNFLQLLFEWFVRQRSTVFLLRNKRVLVSAVYERRHVSWPSGRLPVWVWIWIYWPTLSDRWLQPTNPPSIHDLLVIWWLC